MKGTTLKKSNSVGTAPWLILVSVIVANGTMMRCNAWAQQTPLPNATESSSAEPAKPSSLDLQFEGESIDQWHGFKRHRFQFEGLEAWVVEPKTPIGGGLFSWCLMFPDAFTDRCAAPQLLDSGFHHVYLDVGNTFGSPEAVQQLHAFHRFLMDRGFAKHSVLIGISRGGLYAHRYASEYPESVSVIYGDAAVLDMKSWPGGKGKGKGSPGDWQAMKQSYGFPSEADAIAYDGNPIDRLAPLAQRKIALVYVVGDADDVVPYEENTKIVEMRYKELGGTVEVFHKPGVGHHPHGLDDPKPVVEFIVRHSGDGLDNR